MTADLAAQQRLIRDALDVLALRGDAHTALADLLRFAHTDHDTDGGCTAGDECNAVVRARQIVEGVL